MPVLKNIDNPSKIHRQLKPYKALYVQDIHLID